MTRDYIEPTGVRVTIDGDTAFTRRLGKKVRAAVGDYTDVRSGEMHRYVRLPMTARDLANEVLRAFPRMRYRNGGSVPIPIELSFTWNRRVDGISRDVAVHPGEVDPIGRGLTVLEERWKAAQARGTLSVGESHDEARARVAAEKEAEQAHREELAALAQAAGGELVQHGGGWLGEGSDVALLEHYAVRFSVTHGGVRCTRVTIRAEGGEALAPARFSDLLVRLGGRP
jgi:hypothetical protein